MTRGASLPAEPSISVVVMSTNSDPLTHSAVESLFNSTIFPEIIVVNTGQGTLAPVLQCFQDRIILAETSTRKNPGGTRNIGIAYASAPTIAFLAADCTVPSDWIALRLHAHKNFRAVSSCLRPSPGKNGTITRASWASYIAIHHHRIPEVSPDKARPFGVSYSREALFQVGLFDESVRIGEDSLLNEKLRKITAFQTNREIITFHKYPDNFIDALRDQFKRGRHYAVYNKRELGHGRLPTSISTLKKSLSTYMEIAMHRSSHHPAVRNNNFLALLISFARASGNLFPSDK